MRSARLPEKGGGYTIREKFGYCGMRMLSLIMSKYSNLLVQALFICCIAYSCVLVCILAASLNFSISLRSLYGANELVIWKSLQTILFLFENWEWSDLH